MSPAAEAATAPSPTTIIRPAVLSDVPFIVQMGLRFADSVYAKGLTANPDGFAALTTTFIEGGDKAIFVTQVDERLTGMLAIMTYVQPMSLETVASEVVWWMEPEARGSRDAIKLLRLAEMWAKAHGAVRLQMIAPNAHVGSFYERLGFEYLETHFQRSL